MIESSEEVPFLLKSLSQMLDAHFLCCYQLFFRNINILFLKDFLIVLKNEKMAKVD